MITTVTGKNQITTPAALARELDIPRGTRLDWTKGETDVLIVKIVPNHAELAKRLAGRGRRHLREGSHPIRDLVEDRIRWISSKARKDSSLGFSSIFCLLFR